MIVLSLPLHLLSSKFIVHALLDHRVNLLLSVAGLDGHRSLLFDDARGNARSEREAVRVPTDFGARERQRGERADDERRGHGSELKPQRREREELAERGDSRALTLRLAPRFRRVCQSFADVERGCRVKYFRAPFADGVAHAAEGRKLFAAGGAGCEVLAKSVRLGGVRLAVEVRDEFFAATAAARGRSVRRVCCILLLVHRGATSRLNLSSLMRSCLSAV